MTGSPTRRVGQRGLLVRCGRPATASAALRAGAWRAGIPVQEVVPGADTVLIVAVAPADVDRLAALVAVTALDGEAGGDLYGRAPAPGATVADDPLVEIPVVYDGIDLAAVAEASSRTVAEVIADHQRPLYEAAFCGFAPGFAYLEGLPPGLHLRRRPSPRPRVPAGSVAVADRYSAVYPRATPGGWHLLGRTDVALWDQARQPPALLVPGTRVRFVAVRESRRRPAPTAAAAPRRPQPVTSQSAALEVIDPGLYTTVQDAGRPGHAHEGVAPSGWLDAPAATLANRLVGNDPGDAVLEVTISGPVLRLVGGPDSARRIAVTGARAVVRVDGAPIAMDAPLELPAGSRIDVGPLTGGARAYLAVSGGARTDMVLGSRSTDSLSGLGPPALCAGDVLPLGPDHGRRPPIEVAPVRRRDPVPVLRVIVGPADDLLEPGALTQLVDTTWTVGAQSNRVGLRLTGPPLPVGAGGRAAQMPPQAMVTGAIQVPPSGEPVLFLADHPATGGYPVIAVVVDADLPIAGQLAPGAPVRVAVTRELRRR